MILSFLALGLMQTTIQYIFFYLGLANTTGAKGAIINSSGAFFGVILAPLFYPEDRLSLRKLFGCLVGFIGIVLINMDGSSLSGFCLTGEGFLLIAALAQTLASFYSKKTGEAQTRDARNRESAVTWRTSVAVDRLWDGRQSHSKRKGNRSPDLYGIFICSGIYDMDTAVKIQSGK